MTNDVDMETFSHVKILDFSIFFRKFYKNQIYFSRKLSDCASNFVPNPRCMEFDIWWSQSFIGLKSKSIGICIAFIWNSNPNIYEIHNFVILRIWWAVSLVLSMILFVMAVALIWINWMDHPVTVTFDDKITSIGMIPFPAVTICTTQKNKEGVNLPESAYVK